jgi:hypothetical protein
MPINWFLFSFSFLRFFFFFLEAMGFIVVFCACFEMHRWV